MANEKNQRNADLPSRRRLLKQAASTLPFVATIPSGAALARSSNLISMDLLGGGLIEDGKLLCIDVTHDDYTIYETFVDVGVAPAPLTATRIPVNVQYYRDPGRSGTPLDAYTICEQGGEFHYFNRGPKAASLPVRYPENIHGIYASATALSSFLIANPPRDI